MQSKFYLGQSQKRLAGRRLPIVYRGGAHMLTTGETGSGKTRCVGVPNILSHLGSSGILDTKDGEITKAVAQYLAVVQGHEVRINDPLGVVEEKYVPRIDGNLAYGHFDPLDYIAASRAPHSAAFKIAETLTPANALRETHWGDGAQLFAVAVMKFVKFDPRCDDFHLPRTMETVWLILSDSRFRKQALRLMKDSGDRTVAEQARTYSKMTKDDRELKSLLNQISVGWGKTFGEPGIMASMSSTNISYVDMHKRPITVFHVLPGSLAVTHNKLLKMNSAIMLGEIERAGIVEHDSPTSSIYLHFDEFAGLGKVDFITQALSTHRAFNVKFHLMCQSFGQLHEVYGEGLNSILTNCGAINQIGGTNCEFSAKRISTRSGTRTELHSSWQQGSRPGDQGSYSQSETTRFNYTPDEVMRLQYPKQIIMMSGKNVMEEYILDPGLSHFRDYLAFQECIKQGLDPEDARDFSAQYAVQPSPLAHHERRVAAPAPPKRRTYSFGQLFATLMGHDSD